MVALVSLVLGTLVGTMSSQSVSNYMLSNEIESYNTTQENISENFGGQGFNREGFTPGNRNGKNSNVDYVSTLDVSTDLTTIIELFGVSLLLTIISGVTAVMFVNKYEPNKILQNRG